MIVAATAAHADKWIAATVTETFSASREWFVRVTPGKSLGDTFGFDGSPKGPFAGAEWFRRDAEGGYRVVARATLANPVAPVDTLVTDHGYLVTLDNWHNMGYGAVVAAYRPDGSQVIALRLADLYATARDRGIRDVHVVDLWRSDTVYTRDDQRSVYVAGKVRGQELILEPEWAAGRSASRAAAGSSADSEPAPNLGLVSRTGRSGRVPGERPADAGARWRQGRGRPRPADVAPRNGAAARAATGTSGSTQPAGLDGRSLGGRADGLR